MPDLRGRVLQERDATHVVGSQIEAGLPNITGSVGRQNWANALLWSHTYDGAFYSDAHTSYGAIGDGSNGSCNLKFDASRSNSMFGSSDTVQPPAYAVRYLIRALP